MLDFVKKSIRESSLICIIVGAVAGGCNGFGNGWATIYLGVLNGFNGWAIFFGFLSGVLFGYLVGVVRKTYKREFMYSYDWEIENAPDFLPDHSASGVCAVLVVLIGMGLAAAPHAGAYLQDPYIGFIIYGVAVLCSVVVFLMVRSKQERDKCLTEDDKKEIDRKIDEHRRAEKERIAGGIYCTLIVFGIAGLLVALVVSGVVPGASVGFIIKGVTILGGVALVYLLVRKKEERDDCKPEDSKKEFSGKIRVAVNKQARDKSMLGDSKKEVYGETRVWKVR